MQNYKIFWNKSALQPKICKKEAFHPSGKDPYEFQNKTSPMLCLCYKYFSAIFL